MLRDFKETFKEVAQGVGPIALLILVVEATLLEASAASLLQFTVGTLMLLLGIAFFLLGVKVGLLPMGEAIGSDLPKRGSLLLIVVIAFIFGFLATVAEPDVRVLTGLIETVSGGGIAPAPLILVIATGVGFFVAMAMLRIIYGVPIAYLFAAGYGTVILLSFFTPEDFLSISLDAGAVTTGPITVPFILALGIGISSVLGGRSQISDGFGLIGLASIGPIIGVMVVGVLSA